MQDPVEVKLFHARLPLHLVALLLGVSLVALDPPGVVVRQSETVDFVPSLVARFPLRFARHRQKSETEGASAQETVVDLVDQKREEAAKADSAQDGAQIPHSYYCPTGVLSKS